MKKINAKGFILAETLIVSVFLMVMFTMIYTNFYPLIGEYEKRENYDDVDGKYTAYWIKKIIESNSYTLSTTNISTMNKWGYARFECSNVSTNNNQRELCVNLVQAMEISNCDSSGNGCDIYITRYTIGTSNSPNAPVSLKETIRTASIRRWNELCAATADPFNETTATQTNTSCATVFFKECCRQKGLTSCTKPKLSGEPTYENLYTDPDKSVENNTIAKYCNTLITKKAFSSATKDYILALPNYTIHHTATGAKYRVIVVVRHKKDNNDYYSFSTMEVIK
ncbi:MAG: hypothetical protein J6X28_03765 [Bacilli bacterium]|nr:hypothetical protein [Bacilli bacterium]